MSNREERHAHRNYLCHQPSYAAVCDCCLPTNCALHSCTQRPLLGLCLPTVTRNLDCALTTKGSLLGGPDLLSFDS
jgi:hypothetical protein